MPNRQTATLGNAAGAQQAPPKWALPKARLAAMHTIILTCACLFADIIMCCCRFVVLCCVVSVLVLLQVAPMLGRARLGQLTPAMMQGACLRGPDLLSLPPCPQAFIDRCASAICPYVCLICSTALTCCWYDMLCGTLCLCGIALAWLSSWRLPWGLVC
jgi:hypothetical protein